MPPPAKKTPPKTLKARLEWLRDAILALQAKLLLLLIYYTVFAVTGLFFRLFSSYARNLAKPPATGWIAREHPEAAADSLAAQF